MKIMITLIIAILRKIPESWAVTWLQAVAWVAFFLGIRRNVALENLARAFPNLSAKERQQLAKRNYLHLGACAAEFLRSPDWSDQELKERISPHGWEKVEPYLKKKQGFIICTAHMGNFELFGVYAARQKAPLTILTRPLRGVTNSRWVRTRAMAGIREIHKGLDNLIQAVQNGEVLALLIDQNMLPKRAVFVPFFNQLAATTPAPAVIADRTRAPIFLAFMVREKNGHYRTVIEGPIFFHCQSDDRQKEMLQFTKMINHRLETYISEYPEQWFWLHRRWKTQPEQAAGKMPVWFC